ncbi:hypothetical protein AYR62_00510 [Secundilactobacillus paracollinoides]|uniref:Uncharacterized protein n=1 Tax=Secundilactobacillus paracollinoides TaxID=240427 RepID=A0A1B2IVQ4_9LACO|nr:hypothetical protein [Secundilactobacillus paracollinoides]ANZ60287.1 hypothetical protein AYR61_02245 [Secundilactobacillus paracollinoides]ANZ62727.1 hypothetical protein AYR62_00510 [Secundilactobacillus paracollinoides]ANZ66117.1 hypothetical protein AYR63_02445 [Secundilactobacillus paracollinoides]KRL79104.1 hypothetical protein FC17_GL000724 [Secundilactobacillus paracollinoides DSM 15502 = JCM 11969]
MTPELTAEDLFESYTGTHSSPYDGQMVTVSSQVTYVGPDSYGLPSIEMGNPSDGKLWVMAVVSDYDAVHEGNQVTITGNSTGFTQGGVVLKHSTIVEVA